MKKLFGINCRIISAIICIILTFSLVFTLCSCKKNGEDVISSNSTYAFNDSSIDEANETDSSNETEETEGTDSSSEDEASSNTSSTGSTSVLQNSTSTVGSAVQLPTATNPEGVEILGSGTKDDPYLELPKISDDYMSVTTVSIPAGKTVHYGIQRVVGTILTIENANAYVVYDGKRYDANGGKVSLEVVDAKALASDNIKFEIGNKGGVAASFKLIFTNKTGSRENPTVIKTTGTNNTVNLEADNSVGHYYKYVAEKAGKLRFYISSNADSVISVTDNSTSKNIIGNYIKSSNQLTDPDQGDAVVEYIELDVTKGAEIIISVGATPNKRGKFPAASITWSVKYGA